MRFKDWDIVNKRRDESYITAIVDGVRGRVISLSWLIEIASIKTVGAINSPSSNRLFAVQSIGVQLFLLSVAVVVVVVVISFTQKKPNLTNDAKTSNKQMMREERERDVFICAVINGLRVTT